MLLARCLTFKALCISSLLSAMIGCGPNDKLKAALAEQKRIECSDKFCTGDVDPRSDYVKDELLKFNGQWYIGPKEYFTSGRNGAVIYWPGKSPGFAPGDFPPGVKGQDFKDGAIEIFLRGRQRWPEPKLLTPWLGKDEGRFKELQKEGFRMERQQLRPDLERVRFFDAQGKSYRTEFFIATNKQNPLGTHVPGIGCEPPDENGALHALAGCTGAFFWQEDIYADFRFHAKHANDWPEIHRETIRVLSLLKKV